MTIHAECRPTDYDLSYAKKQNLGKAPRCSLCGDQLPISPWNVKPDGSSEHVKLCKDCALDYFDSMDEQAMAQNPEIAAMDAHLRSIRSA